MTNQRDLLEVTIDKVITSLEFLSGNASKKGVSEKKSFGENVEILYWHTGLKQAFDGNEIIFSRDADLSLRELEILCDELADNWNLEDEDLLNSLDMHVIREKAKSCLKLIDISDASESTVKYVTSDQENSQKPLWPFDQFVTVVDYERLIKKFIRQEITTEQFVGSVRYASCMLDKFPVSNELNDVLRTLYNAADNLVADPSLGIPPFEDDVTEEQLREIAEKSYFKIKELYISDGLYEKKLVAFKGLFPKLSWMIFFLALFVFFGIHTAINFGFMLQAVINLEGILQFLNRFALCCTFAALSGIVGETVSFEIREIKRLYLSILLPKPPIEAFEDA